jgi:leucyl-tRNA synthetase
MSKSRGNVVNPDDYVQTVGADAVRVYLMFIGPWEQGGPWSLDGIEGASRWLGRVWTLVTEPLAKFDEPDQEQNRAILRGVHQTIRRVTDDLEGFRFNTMVAAMMELTTMLARAKASGSVRPEVLKRAIDTLILLIAPSAPHLAEELWSQTGHQRSVHLEAWPEYDADLARDDVVTLIVQVDGKLRDKLAIAPGLPEEDAVRLAMQSPRIVSAIGARGVRRTIYRADRLLNFVLD